MKTRSASLVLAGLTAFCQAALLQGSVFPTDPNLPVLYPNGVYLYPATGPVFNGPGLNVVFSGVQDHALARIISPSGPDEIESYSGQWSGLISVNLSPPAAFTASGPEMSIAHGKFGITIGDFPTELLSMNLSGTSPFGPFMIRESPTLASLGHASIADIGGGLFKIDSFFDVFTELSVDGGNSWIPSQGSSHVILDMPEPGTVSLVAPGVLLWLGIRRYRARS